MTAGQTGCATRELPAALDPVRAARALAAGGAAWYWLDGEAPAPGERPVSYLGAAAEVRVARSGEERGFLAELRRGLRDGDPADAETRPRDGFGGGWVVALGYEFGVGLLGARPAPDDAPPALALRAEVVLAVDHASGRAELRGPSEAVLDAWWARHGDALASRVPERCAEPAAPVGAEPETDPAWRSGDAAYLEQLAACERAIRDGDAYVLCLTDTAEARGAFDPLDLFLRLRGRGAAARGGLIVAGDRALVSASPERFLSVAAGPNGREVATRPIKGTRPRHADPARDAALAAELAADPKERAENLMIVDLMRNDLGRVCAPGSVGVERFLSVESHAHVHQLVSTVRGALAEGRDVFDAIESCFPGGSMTGAPKRSAVEILAALEGAPRGLYAGCFGWIDAGGSAELAMTIRGLELREPLRDARRLRFRRALAGAGGGVTSDSDPALELAEKHLKAAALLGALDPVF